jgi:hypothetical protein
MGTTDSGGGIRQLLVVSCQLPLFKLGEPKDAVAFAWEDVGGAEEPTTA